MKFRSVCHIIGYFDLVLTILGLLVGLLFCLSFLLGWFPFSEDEKFNAPEASDPSHANDSTFNNIIIGAMIFMIIMLFIIGGVQIYCSVLLIKGTKKGVLPRDGLTNCSVWRRVNFVFIILMSMNLLRRAASVGSTQDYVLNLSALGVRVLALLIVHLHIKQLEMEVGPIVEDI